MSDIFKISSIIIAKNEENKISRCIESQLPCIDEIIVLIDQDTTDSTASLVKEYPEVKSYVSKWRGFAGMKEFAVSLAHNDWIFWIDADEEITPGLAEELLLLKITAPRDMAYSVPRKAYFLGKWMKHSGWYPSRVTRLFNKNSAYFNMKNVHEHLVVNGSTGELKGDLNHYTDDNIKHYFNKFNSYTSLAADELALKNKKFMLSDIILRPLILFIKMYIIKGGFLDGIRGFILAVYSSFYVFTKYSKLWEIQSSKKNKPGDLK